MFLYDDMVENVLNRNVRYRNVRYHVMYITDYKVRFAN